MRLVHYSKEPVKAVNPVVQTAGDPRWGPKPVGLWVSDEDEYGWSQWCTEEDFCNINSQIAHEVELVPDHRILFLQDAEDLLNFTKTYGVDRIINGEKLPPYWLDWPAVSSLYRGIMITPYIYSCRLLYETSWYYPWDCASGCIWDPAAIASISVLDKVDD